MTVCSKLLDYNLVDVEGVHLLNQEWGMIQDQFEQAWIVMAPPEDGVFTSKLHDHDIITEFRGKLVFDTKYANIRNPKTGKKRVGPRFVIREEYDDLTDIGKKGGYVPPAPPIGIYEWIVVIDFHKFYPNMIMSSNAGIRTALDVDREYWFTVLDKKGRIWDRKDLIETPVAFFRKDVDSVNKHKFKKWLSRRKILQKKAVDYLESIGGDTDDPQYKKMWIKQFRVKNFTNGGFGVFGLPSDRNYSKLAFNSTTISCQDLIKKTIQIVRNKGYDIVGGDTDSIFLQLKSRDLESAIKESNNWADEINKELDIYLKKVYNFDDDHTMEIGVETISDKFIIKAQKNYVKRNLYVDGIILDNPKLEVKGLSLKKRATSFFSADMQRLCLDILLNSDDYERDFRELAAILNYNIDKMPWDYVAPRGAINKKIEEYDKGNNNARGARHLKECFNINVEDGENPYIFPFKVYPSKLNGHFLKKFGSFFMLSFYEELIPKIKACGFEPDWNELKRTQIKLKSDPFFSLIGKDFYELIAETKVADDEVL